MKSSDLVKLAVPSITTATKCTDTEEATIDGGKAPVTGQDDVLASYHSAMRNARIKHIEQNAGSNEFTTLHNALLLEDPGLVEVLSYQQVILLDAELGAKKDPCTSTFMNVIDRADKCIALIDADAIALNLGKLVPKDNKNAAKARKEAEDAKKSLVNALQSKCCAYISLADIAESNISIDSQSYDYTLFDAVYQELSFWCDMSSPEFTAIKLRRLRVQKRYTYILLLAIGF